MKPQNNTHIVLYAPEIPGNTGSIGRTCLALGMKLHLIKPYGFDLSQKAVRRAGLDYWKYVDITEHEAWEDFLTSQSPSTEELFFFESQTKDVNNFDVSYPETCYLIFGAETKGLPKTILQEYPDRFVTLPMFSQHIRSLNLSNSVTAAAYEVVRQRFHSKQ